MGHMRMPEDEAVPMIDTIAVVELARELELVKPGTEIDPAKPFAQNGIDSLDVMTLLLAVEERERIKLSEDEVGRIRCIDDLVEAVSHRGKGAQH